MKKNYRLLLVTTLLMPNLLLGMEEKPNASSPFQEMLQKKKELKQHFERVTDDLEKLLGSIYTTQTLEQKKSLAEQCLEMAITLYKTNKEKFLPSFDKSTLSDKKNSALCRRFVIYTRAIQTAQLFNIPIQREDHDALLIGVMANDTWYASRLHKGGANPLFRTPKTTTALSLAESTLKTLQSATPQDLEKIGQYKFLHKSLQVQQSLETAKPPATENKGRSIFKDLKAKQQELRNESKQICEKYSQLLDTFVKAGADDKESIAQECIANAYSISQNNSMYHLYKKIITTTLEFNPNIYEPLLRAIQAADLDFVQTLLTRESNLQMLDNNQLKAILENNASRLDGIIIPNQPERDSTNHSSSYEAYYQKQLANHAGYIESFEKEKASLHAIQELLEKYRNTTKKDS